MPRKRLESDRTAVGAHAVAIASEPPEAVRRLLLVLTFRRFPRQIPQMFYALAQIFRAQQVARPPHQTCCRNVVFLAVALHFLRASIPGRNMVRPERIVGLCPGTARCHRRFTSAAGEPENSKWNENKISEGCAGLGRLGRPIRNGNGNGKIKRTSVRGSLRS